MVVQGHTACRVDKGEFCIDTLSLSIDLSVIADGIDDYSEAKTIIAALEEPDDRDDFTLVRYFRRFVARLFPSDSLQLIPQIRTGRNFFNNRLDFDNDAGFIAFGGNNNYIDKEGEERSVKERAQIYITGEGCRIISDFVYLARQIQSLSDYSPKITRIDIAYDDHEGFRDLSYCQALYQTDQFIGNGRPPKARLIDDFGSGDGSSMYVGSKKSGKELNCYEKGKQLGDPSSKWVRWEGRIYSKDREIPIDVLTHYEEYLVGMYPALEFMDRASRVILTERKKEQIQYEHLVKHARNSYGPLIHFMKMRGLSDTAIISNLIKLGAVPSRLQWTTVSNDLDPPDQVVSVEESHPHLFEVRRA